MSAFKLTNEVKSKKKEDELDSKKKMNQKNPNKLKCSEGT